MTSKSRIASFAVPPVVLAALSMAVLGGRAPTARADSVVTVPSFICAAGADPDHPGVVFRPAGSTIVIRSRVAEQTRGTLKSFLNAQTTILSINGGTPIDETNHYSAPFFVPNALGSSIGFWEAGVDTPTGITLASPGDSLTFHLRLSLARLVAEVFNPANGGPAGAPGMIGPGTVIDGNCTVIAT